MTAVSMKHIPMVLFMEDGRIILRVGIPSGLIDLEFTPDSAAAIGGELVRLAKSLGATVSE